MSTDLNGTAVRKSLLRQPDRVYQNAGNLPLVRMLGGGERRILDVGCGAGDNAQLILANLPDCEVHGVTHSQAESELARRRMTSCSVWDIEGEIPAGFAGRKFDAIIFSHVLEHLRNPELVLEKFTSLISDGGSVLIAVPNALSWAMRWQFLRGDFEYRSDGVLDDTHLRFFTYVTADKYLLSKTPGLRLLSKGVSGSVPQWWLRRYLLPKKTSEFIDRLGCDRWPNLFGGQVLIKAVRDGQ
jgi:2-polyprenyl-3-methyl-5-hydroxy-6-metoxy-1,4-benzoquinol methylase